MRLFLIGWQFLQCVNLSKVILYHVRIFIFGFWKYFYNFLYSPVFFLKIYYFTALDFCKVSCQKVSLSDRGKLFAFQKDVIIFPHVYFSCSSCFSIKARVSHVWLMCISSFWFLSSGAHSTPSGELYLEKFVLWITKGECGVVFCCY